jgi:hypothetical protein
MGKSEDFYYYSIDKSYPDGVLYPASHRTHFVPRNSHVTKNFFLRDLHFSW